MDHDFHARTFTVAVVSMLVFSGLVTSAYLDLQLCPYNRDGNKEGSAQRVLSVFDPNFTLFPCHLVDLVAWIYIVCFVVFMGHKWFMYKALGWHYFLLDYCYFHNLTLCALLLWSMIDLSNDNNNNDSYMAFGIPIGIGGYRFDIKPIGVAVSLLSSFGRKIYIFIFFGLLSGSCGALLGAIYIWNNALVFHSEDKMTACYLHLAPATVQVILLHGAMISVSHRETSTSRDLMKSCFSYSFLVGSHFAMFLIWQVFYHAVNELRSFQRRQKAKKLAAKGIPVDTGILSKRITAYTWMMEKPMGGKNGIGYRFVTCLGMQEYRTKFMFSVTQALTHLALLTVGFLPMHLAAQYWDVWPLLLYIAFFFVFSIRNAAIILKRWIQKMQKEAVDAKKLLELSNPSSSKLEESQKSASASSTASTTTSSSSSRASSVESDQNGSNSNKKKNK